jgi:fatty-acyl-CoA synthase
MSARTRLRATVDRASQEVSGLRALTRAGVLGLDRPSRMAEVAKALRTLGPFAAAPKIAAIRHGDQPAIADERGQISYRDFDESIDRLADVWRTELPGGATVGILCRNHRAPLIAAFAASRAGLNAVWLNTAFSARQASEVAAREGVDLLVRDADLADLAVDISTPYGEVVCDVTADRDHLDALIARGTVRPGVAPARPGRIVLLTSGTTGTPKGAPRPEPKGFVVAGSVVQRMPMRSREATVIGPPLFHGTGLLLALMTITLGSKLVLRRRFDAAEMLADIEAHRASTVCVVPIMLQRILALDDVEIAGRDLGTLRIVFCAGSQLPAAVGTRAQEVLGEVVYNLYGSTEVALATLATPADVRDAPTSVGRPLLGARVKVLDEAGAEVPPGVTGRIFVGTIMPFEGYTGGGGKEVVDGMLATGDVGHFDEAGRLYIDGRDDEMIVSGGENVFPREVEELLAAHPAVADVAAIGVDDEEFGERLRAFVVLRSGATASEDELKDHVRSNLARYKTPRDVVFLEALPRNPTGKVLKRELAAWVAPD